MMRCGQCDHPVAGDSMFCENCGALLGQQVVAEGPRMVHTDNIRPDNIRSAGMVQFPSPEEKLTYEKWKLEGRISKGTADLLLLVGIFIFGWLMWYVYNRAGKSGIFFIGIFFLFMLSFVNPVFWFIGLAAYIWAWVNIRNVIGRHELLFAQETGMI